uniref:Pre-mRNA-processing factor 39 n=1 Tax=Nelumbo nucifera TaxID=4432 RepID=A0A822YU32_NELNU|nr:TPA_asm: hypothetical protein HUJ06_008255 [Nelumbo nucifera]
MDTSDPSNDLDEPVGSDEAKNLEALITKCSGDFDSWTSLIAEIEKASPDDMGKISLVYDSFLSEYPLCYGYWKKYANHMARLNTIDKAVEVYERAVQSATYCVNLWVEYCSFGMLLFEDPVDGGRLFERGISFVGKDYWCYFLWDKYIAFEYSQKQWSSLAYVYIRTLRFPNKKLHSYYDSFKKLAAIWKDEIECQNKSAKKEQSEVVLNCETREAASYQEKEILGAIKDIFKPAIGLHNFKGLQKYLLAGEWFYQKARKLDAKIHCFESQIRRPYFHVKPLDANQLENWHHYLDFVEMQGDFDWTVKLYERCLIPCANYPEFWMRYVELMETKGGREMANFALVRATQVFLKRVPAIHLFCARFREQIGDVVGARSAFPRCDPELDSDFIESVAKEANMEKRLGNFGAASNVYEKALQMAKEKQNSHFLSILYVHFSRFKYMITGSIDATREVLIEGIHHLPYCRLLLEELINFEMMHGGPRQVNVLDAIVANAISPRSDVSKGLNTQDREDISSLYLEFLDLCGTIHDIMKAWNRHWRLFPHLMRPPFPCKHPAKGNHTQEMAKEVRRDTLIPLPSCASENDSSHDPFEHPRLNQKFSVYENPDIQSNNSATGQSQLEEANDVRQEQMQQVTLPAVEEESWQDAVKQNEDAYDLVHEAHNGPQSTEAVQKYSNKENKLCKASDQESKFDPKLPSLEGLSLNTDHEQDSAHTTSRGCEAPQETPRSNGSRLQDGGDDKDISVSNMPCTKADDPAGVHSQTENDSPHKAMDPGSPQAQTHSQSISHTDGPLHHNVINGGNLHQMSFTGQTPRDTNLGFHGYPQAQHPQQWQVSPNSSVQPAEIHSQMPMNQGYPCQPPSWQIPQVQHGPQVQNQHQVASAHVQTAGALVWPAHNVQQQGFACAPHSQVVTQHVSYPQGHVYPYPLQNSEQNGHMQINEAYATQMWQYYYYQQQQQQQHQQHVQQLQYQQQSQQQQQLQYHQQQQQQPQQALYHQHQQQPQPPHCHQQQQHPQNQQQQPPQHNNHHQQQQQITSLQMQTWNNYYQQVQGVAEHNIEESRPIAHPHPSQQPSNQ